MRWDESFGAYFSSILNTRDLCDYKSVKWGDIPLYSDESFSVEEFDQFFNIVQNWRNAYNNSGIYKDRISYVYPRRTQQKQDAVIEVDEQKLLELLEDN